MVVMVCDYFVLQEYYMQNHHKKYILKNGGKYIKPLFIKPLTSDNFSGNLVELNEEEIKFLIDNNLIYNGDYDRTKIKVKRSFYV